ncbi:hypothetical protein CH063_00336 [Colletotrichum higginsianum]|uniref:Uncharacterized protein n=1 Tax=Colletotrichum higginsianum (strain IMI 349063) TaxID=759273 RepID=H1VIA4_COLHI|nr:hypothetical protein CH063_00336 [Colletotrichum higginsianum]
MHISSFNMLYLSAVILITWCPYLAVACRTNRECELTSRPFIYCVLCPGSTSFCGDSAECKHTPGCWCD